MENEKEPLRLIKMQNSGNMKIEEERKQEHPKKGIL